MTSDQIEAADVIVATGVNLNGEEIGSGTWPRGFQFTMIENTSTNPTLGTFATLNEGSEFAVGNNLFAISYIGGDGNDVVLTNMIPEPDSVLLTALATVLIATRRRRKRLAT